MKGRDRSRYTKSYTEILTEQGGGGAAAESCSSISFSTQLQKVTSAVRTLSVGDELKISKRKGALIVISAAGDECGSIVSTQNLKLMECMDKGYSYKATVISRTGSVCKVRVKIA